MSLLSLHNITHHFTEEDHRRFLVLDKISFDVHEGEFVCLIGPSGCGKSTLLRIIAGLMKAEAGEILMHGRPPVPEEPEDAMVFQHFALFPFLNVEENIEFGLKMFDVPKAERSKRVHHLIREMGLIGAEHRYPKELSGGMKQRVGLARAFAVQPKVLLMDEPFSALDAFTAATLRNEVLRVWQASKQTIIMVTHLVEEAIELADRIVVLSTHPGRVVRIMDNHLPRPRDKRSKQFFTLVDELTSYVRG